MADTKSLKSPLLRRDELRFASEDGMHSFRESYLTFEPDIERIRPLVLVGDFGREKELR